MKVKHKKTHLIPALLFAALVALFFESLRAGHDSTILPSPLIGTAAPEFTLQKIQGVQDGFLQSDLKGEVTLVNFFASWCVPCLAEAPQLVSLHASHNVKIYGIAYKDKPDAIKDWLQKTGNPYAGIGGDPSGAAAIAFGVYGVPENFIIDAGGVIRYKHVGPIMPQDVQKILDVIKGLKP